eukprot:TRINITY_DN9098_c0_g2_i1.p1 TRINITY_DN9098_c0_g2~~TRINITY_DN9098_c0_g2_i1.p1  ORF type:complete len:269 (+),score=46.54 TRINITY_DN9098_c0_g2_i1:63-869(+)
MAAIPASGPSKAANSTIPLLNVEKLKVCTVEGKKILNSVSMRVGGGEVHVVMGPNGCGKSSFVKAVGGDPGLKTEGTVKFMGKTAGDPEERARNGLFVGQQTPIEIPGLPNREFLFHALTERYKTEKDGKILSVLDFEARIDDALEMLDIKRESKKGKLLVNGPLNAGFSGGERKLNEIFHLLVLKPKLAILDEPDSGLDVDATKKVGIALQKYLKSAKDLSLVLVTHAASVLHHVRPTHVHVFENGGVKETGGTDLVGKILTKGFGT